MKIEVGQVYKWLDTNYYMLIADTNKGYLFADTDNYVSEETIQNNYVLYRNADGIKALKEVDDEK